MSEVWFIGDTHFGHTNILKYEENARPFKTVEEMNEKLIANWNSVVGHSDVVWHLGDFCFGRHNIAIAGRLNGKKRLVMGNHDAYHAGDYLMYFEKLYGVKYWERCILSHVPVHIRHVGERFLLNVHGHLHSKVVHSPRSIWFPDLNYFNVSCEQNNLTPIHADKIRDRIREIDG